MSQFNVYVSNTSKASKLYFPGNTKYQFTNVLAVPLSDMLKYKVCLSSCVLSPPIPEGNQVIHITTDIVKPSFYDERMLAVVGTLPSLNAWTPKPVYVPVSRNDISAINITLTDAYGNPIQLNSDLLLTLTFKRLKESI